MSTTGCERINADQQHIHQQRPRVALRQEVHRGTEHEEAPQEVPEVLSESKGTLSLPTVRDKWICLINKCTIGSILIKCRLQMNRLFKSTLLGEHCEPIHFKMTHLYC